MESIVRLFSVDELRGVLETAASRLLRAARERYCEGLSATRTVFLIAGTDELLDATKTAEQLLRPDGWHRPDVRLGPVATCGDALVVEVSWPLGNEWTDRIFVGQEAFPEEPFILTGPALPAGWSAGQPTPKVKLPEWESFQQ
ncbi:MAG: hypothetical protein ACT4QC_12625 [Planctomycetaceae bacterium]